MLARIQAWFVLPMLYFLFLALEGLGTGHLKSRLCSLLSKQEGKRMVAKSGDGHTSTSGIRIQLHCVQSSANTFSAKHCADCAMCNV